jgi:hypothetical protein
MIRAMGAALCGALALACAACDGTIFKTFNLKQGESLSIDARQRLVFVGDRDVLDGAGRATGRKVQVVCTEPSPDAIVAKAAAIAASATSPQIAAALSGSFTESAASIGVRTPTIQLLRDGLFRACEAYMNGILTRQDYHVILFNYDRIMAALLIVEAAAGFQTQPNISITAGTVTADAVTQLTPGAPAKNSDGTPKQDGAQNPPTGNAEGKAGAQPGSGQSAGSGGGYNKAADSAKDVLLEVARAMLEDGSRYGFCVTPPASEVDFGPSPAAVSTAVTAPSQSIEPRNKYFHAICQTMVDSLSEQLKAVSVRNRLKEKCVANPNYLPACKTLTW